MRGEVRRQWRWCISEKGWFVQVRGWIGAVMLGKCGSGDDAWAPRRQFWAPGHYCKCGGEGGGADGWISTSPPKYCFNRWQFTTNFVPSLSFWISACPYGETFKIVNGPDHLDFNFPGNNLSLELNNSTF
ncbi:hypothetical protein PIB30_070663 [Stylosanthes scabra]|uniref:Uncharacterized protein n=1 Tax=Stylosanthes scabra TaxID=79078 RepID=A0ABU6TN68_9FABA|nr:hypothetical protein [Stylosanthes scabra]